MLLIQRSFYYGILIASLLGLSIPSTSTVQPLTEPAPAIIQQEACIPPTALAFNRYLPFVVSPALPTLEWQPSIQVVESQASVLLTLTLTSPGYASVNVATLDGTAYSGQDYTAITQTIHFTPQQLQQTLSIPLLADTVAEGDETFLVRLSDLHGGSYTQRVGTITIQDDDNDIALQSSLHAINLTSQRAYEWRTTVTPAADAVPTLIGTPQTVGYTVRVERGALGPTLYSIVGTLAITNTSTNHLTFERVQLGLYYQLGTTQWLTDTNELILDRDVVTLAPSMSISIPVSLTFSFATATGAAPSNLSALQLRASTLVANKHYRITTISQRMVALPLPSPTTQLASVTVTQSGILSPTTGFTISGGDPSSTVVSATPLNSSTSYTVTRLSAAPGELRHELRLNQADILVYASTALQAATPSELPTIELVHVDPIDAYLNRTTPLTVTARVRPGIGLNPAAIQLVELDANDGVLRTLGQFVDDGQHADGVANDGIYGVLGSITWPHLGSRRLAAQATLLNQSVLRAERTVNVIEPKSDAAWATYLCVLDAAHDQFAAQHRTQPLVVAQASTLAWIQSRQGVSHASLNNDEIFIQFSSGLEAFVSVADPNSLALSAGGPAQTELDTPTLHVIAQPTTTTPRVFPSSNQAAVINTIPAHVASTNKKYLHIQSQLRLAGYSLFVYEDQAASLKLFRELHSYGVVLYLGHGGWQENSYRISSGQLKPKNESSLDEVTQRDIQQQRIYPDKREERMIYHMRASFFRDYYSATRPSLNDGIWLMISCRALYQDDFANLMHNRGLKALVGFDEYIWAERGLEMVGALLDGMVSRQQSLSDALNAIPNRSIWWDKDGDSYKETFVTFTSSAGSAPDYGLLKSGFINGTFETGTTSGWITTPGRKLVNVFATPPAYYSLTQRYAARLGPATYPPQTPAGTSPIGTDRLSQAVIIPRRSAFLEFDYAMSSYLPANGAFVVKIYQGTSTTLLGSYEIKRYPGSGQQYPNFWYITPQHYQIPVRSFAGQAVTIVFENQQTGSNDQAVYLDNIRLR